MSDEPMHQLMIRIKRSDIVPQGFMEALREYLEERARIVVMEFENEILVKSLESDKTNLNATWGAKLQEFQKKVIAGKNR